MAYSDFKTIRQFEEKFGFQQRLESLFQKRDLHAVKPSEHLTFDLQEAAEIALLNSEKAKSEFIISPILRELRRRNKTFAFFSGYAFDVDKAQKLTGVCDFLLSTNVHAVEIKSPVVCLVEAKNRTIEEGFGQCAAEMYAARLLNERDDEPYRTIYGCVTTASEWHFLRLEDNFIIIDRDRYLLSELGILLAIFEKIIQFYTK